MAPQGRGGHAPPGPRAPRVNRDQVCPFLVRVFVSQGGHHPLSDYSIDRLPTREEYQIFTWRDATVQELLLGVRDVAPSLRSNDFGRFSVRLVYYDSAKDGFVASDMGNVSVQELLSSREASHPRANRSLHKSLDEAKFVIGDYIDLAYLPQPGGSASVGQAPIGTAAGAGAGGFGREPPPHVGGGGPGGRGAFGGPPGRGGWGPASGGRGERGGWGREAAVPGPARTSGSWAAGRGGGRVGSGAQDGPSPRRRSSRSESPVRGQANADGDGRLD